MTEKQDIQVAKLGKDINYIREALDRNFKDHQELKLMFENGLDEKVGKARFKPVEMITFTLAGGVLVWALNQLLNLLSTVKAFF